MTPTLLRNRYRVIRELADGGFGKTFLAEDTDTPSKRRCVIKQLKPVTDNPQIYQLVQERFQREAVILEELGDGSHQIPKLYAYFVENGQFYLVQEWIQGQTLTNKLQQEGILSESTVKEILLNILPVLEYVHSKHIVHRDIKPDNIILRLSDSKPVLIDFGAVKETMGTVITASGNSSRSIIIGTPGFMPSEQSVGRPVFSSDLYSLGLTAIYLLTGKMPQELETDPLTGEIIWRQHALNVSPSLAAVLDKTIVSYARDRFSSAKEMLQALQPTSYTPTPPLPQPPTETSPPPDSAYVQQQPIYSPPPATQTKGLADWQKAVIIGSVIGAFLVGGLLVMRQTFNQSSPQPAVFQPTTSPEPSSNSPPSFIQPPASFSQQQAVALIDTWLQAKQKMFAPPYNRQLAFELTTGEQYQKTAGTNGSIDWLENNNAYYKFGVQKIDGVDTFVSNTNQATIQVRVTEDRTLYKNGRIDPNETDFKTRTVRYNLEKVDQQWKIANTQILN